MACRVQDSPAPRRPCILLPYECLSVQMAVGQAWGGGIFKSRFGKDGFLLFPSVFKAAFENVPRAAGLKEHGCRLRTLVSMATIAIRSDILAPCWRCVHPFAHFYFGA